MTISVPINQLGDMTIMLSTGEIPPKMWKALAVIADRLHPAYEEATDGLASSHDKCLFTSLAVRDFLVGIGFEDATARGVAFYIRAIDRNDRKELWSLGIGTPGETAIPDKFNGHAVCTVPSLNMMIDTALYPAIRPQWLGSLTGMMAMPVHKPWSHQSILDRPSIAGIECLHADRRVEMLWLDRPELQWKQSEDFRVRNARRIAVTRAMRETFGDWKDDGRDHRA